MTMTGALLWPRPVFVPLKANRKRLNKSYGITLFQYVKLCRYQRSLLMLLHQQGTRLFNSWFVSTYYCWDCTSILDMPSPWLKGRNERPDTSFLLSWIDGIPLEHPHVELDLTEVMFTHGEVIR